MRMQASAQHGPAAGATHGRGVWGRLVGLVGLVEAVGGAIRRQYPRGGEVAGWIACEQVAEVDQAAEGCRPW